MRLTDEQQKEVVELYRYGNTAIEIAKAYNVSESHIYQILHYQQEPTRHHAKYKFLNETQKKEIIELYRSGNGSTKIGKLYGLTGEDILSFLRYMNEPRRAIEDRSLCFSADQENEIIKLYRSRKTAKEIAEIYNVSKSYILSILHNLKEPIRKAARIKKINEEQEKEIIGLYRLGKTSKEIGEIYRTSYTSILNILHEKKEPTRNQIKKRISETKKHKFAALYNSGINSIQIGKIYNVSSNHVIKIARKFNVRIRTYGETIRKPIKNFYICSICKQEKSYDEMVKSKLKYSGITSCCLDCSKERSLTKRIIKYGITLDDYRDMLKKQGGKCAVCGSEIGGRDKWGGFKILAIDHNHTTGKVRGLLCSSCNTSIGFMKDNPELLRKAAQYLENNA